MDELEKLLSEADRRFFGDASGQGRDLPGALALLRQAAALGSAQAHQDLGELCWAGEGCPADLQAALGHFASAVDLGSVDAMVPWALALMESGHQAQAMSVWGGFWARAQAADSGWTRRRTALALACLLQLCVARGWPLPFVPVFAQHEAELRAHLAHTLRRLAAQGLEGQGQVGAQIACLDVALRSAAAAA